MQTPLWPKGSINWWKKPRQCYNLSLMERKFTNRLINETSPYLLQHAHNPVDWYPWGEEAIERARREDKPILLSIGYSACHWCHVMERESFENEEIARLMNENFVCIKVDREERPDLDAIYMSAVQMMTGHGGWPLTVFLTPNLKPFYGGTYFPPTDRQGMWGFPRVLLAVADHYKKHRAEAENIAEEITRELRNMNRFARSAEMLTEETLNQAYIGLARSFDRAHGGFGGAPKFPPSMALMFLLRFHKRTHLEEPLHMVELTLDRMASGGMYDHIGGGFHRYSVDARWFVPHFEKMLYDNALLARAYLYAYQATKRDRYRDVAQETIEYLIRDMMSPEGGFYSSEDADSEGEEGKFYTWTRAEILDLLGREEGTIFCEYFGVAESGNFEGGRSILAMPYSEEEFAKRAGIQIKELRDLIARCKKLLFWARQERIRPGRDEKVLTDWNGLALTAFAEAANILGRDDYRMAAKKNADFLLGNLSRDGRLLHACKDRRAGPNGYLNDYANLVEGLLALYEASFELEYFERAKQLADSMVDLFWDQEEGGFFLTSKDHEALIAPVKEYFDNATPSGNSSAALALLRLALFTGENKYRNYALEVLRMLQAAMSRLPSAFGYMLCALDFYLSGAKEIAIVGSASSHEVRQMLEQICSDYLPNKVLALAEPDDPKPASLMPLLADKKALDGKVTVYVCRNYACMAPATTPEELAERLRE